MKPLQFFYPASTHCSIVCLCTFRGSELVSLLERCTGRHEPYFFQLDFPHLSGWQGTGTIWLWWYRGRPLWIRAGVVGAIKWFCLSEWMMWDLWRITQGSESMSDCNLPWRWAAGIRHAGGSVRQQVEKADLWEPLEKMVINSLSRWIVIRCSYVHFPFIIFMPFKKMLFKKGPRCHFMLYHILPLWRNWSVPWSALM